MFCNSCGSSNVILQTAGGDTQEWYCCQNCGLLFIGESNTNNSDFKFKE